MNIKGSFKERIIINMFNRKDLTTTSLGLRFVIGGYFLYLAYSLLPTIQNEPTKFELIAFYIAGSLFVLVGGGLIFFTVKALIKGEYVKGNKKEAEDVNTNPENIPTIEDNENEDDINHIDDTSEDRENDEEK